MAKFRKKTAVIDASQWHQNGDHPLDDYTAGTPNEGRLVRRYRHPDIDGKTECKDCGYIMHVHGWIDSGGDGHTVCPEDWIITNEHNEHYPRKPDIFEQTYEAVE